MFDRLKRKEELDSINAKIKKLENKISALELIIKKLKKSDKDISQ